MPASVELTKDPDAMISALRKIAGHSELAAPSQIQEMFLDHPREKGFARLFATHPSIDDRVAALVKFGGGRDPRPDRRDTGGHGARRHPRCGGRPTRRIPWGRAARPGLTGIAGCPPAFCR
ncbi:MAG: hypothetical protein WDM94_01525 [Bauldia sp.]